MDGSPPYPGEGATKSLHLRYKRARRVAGGLNLLLAFNGVCKLYSKKGEIRGRLCAQREQERGEEQGAGKSEGRRATAKRDGELDGRGSWKEATHSPAPTQITRDSIFPRLLRYHFRVHFSISRPPGPVVALSFPPLEIPLDSPGGEREINSINPAGQNIPPRFRVISAKGTNYTTIVH